LAKGGVPLENELDFAVITGHMLLTMVKGRAFHLYISTITPILLRPLSEVHQIASDKLDTEEQSTILKRVMPNQV
jgi:Tfp pilus assembly ATPase PilU